MTPYEEILEGMELLKKALRHILKRQEILEQKLKADGEAYYEQFDGFCDGEDNDINSEINDN